MGEGVARLADGVFLVFMVEKLMFWDIVGHELLLFLVYLSCF